MRRAGDYHAHASDPGGASVGRLEILRERPDLAAVWAAADASFPVRVTRSFWRRIHRADPDDPLARQVLPDPAELLPAAGDLDDPVGDRRCSPVPWVVHKYPDRVLLLMTKRCHLYCRYCFRRTHAPGELLDPTPEERDRAMEYAVTCGAREVILSGGDPLTCTDAELDRVMVWLRGRGVEALRVHTRGPITCPQRVSPALIDVLARHGPRVVVHCNHPRELAPDVREALQALLGAGLEVLNQAVLLAGVNDEVGVLIELCDAMADLGVRPYYLHHTDAVTGNAHLRVPVSRGLELYAGVVAALPPDRTPRYVIDPPEGSGKVDVTTWVLRDEPPVADPAG